MTDRGQTSRRREFLRLGLTGALLSTAGCSQQFTSSIGTDEGERTPPDLDGATFVFRYDAQSRSVEIEFTGGTPLRAGNVQIRTESGTHVPWAELGSTTTDTDQRLEAGSTAMLGEDVINWRAEVAPDESIRLVYTGRRRRRRSAGSRRQPPRPHRRRRQPPHPLRRRPPPPHPLRRRPPPRRGATPNRRSSRSVSRTRRTGSSGRRSIRANSSVPSRWGSAGRSQPR